ncbi:hypothetical protein [Sphingobium sp. CR28]|uniref:hypothetical protein n=1 Tax=Sphingobium sp. CR28 TaxID=3400272 RepID=UPI003FEDF4FE
MMGGLFLLTREQPDPISVRMGASHSAKDIVAPTEAIDESLDRFPYLAVAEARPNER